ncbi:vitamin B12-dependent ribonucleotide reductase [Enterococcus hirae]|uniref:vitamin B12-dependent ribonucleotide reductase n=1 Tax=Enterococcus TaxID=1350 RepID=UPI0004D83BB4|nr:vitamin B12-dependent ribonucleotide reductase [Enterococcus hirae]KDR92190.1 ribonucleotide-diphosphate reductase subunit alpha [Enterococcus hirae]QQB25009.1 vitamin B12-dependent ribonucleotide reductase [Enterococcus hirae]STD80230.1 ribonucleotide-diphosphate reductase subunit alpha [Enterococcus hirae]
MGIYSKKYIEKLNQDIRNYPEVKPIDPQMKLTFEGISRLIMLDRYTYKDPHNQTLTIGDLVVLTVHADPQYPARGIGTIIQHSGDDLTIEVEEEFRSSLTDPEEIARGFVKRNKSEVEKPLELYYEQIAARVASGISQVEGDRKAEFFEDFYKQLTEQNLIPAGRVLYGAGTQSEVTYFNCFVMPFIQDSRSGLAKHREEVMEIMSRGGGVGTNGSTLRPKSAVVHGVNGKSSGAVSWLNDLANLTHLVEQGGSRRGAQMIMLNDWHPDIFEFIISKIQNPLILQQLITTSKNPLIKQLASEKLAFSPLTQEERELFEVLLKEEGLLQFAEHTFIKEAKQKLKMGGSYSVKDPDFLTGANISICLTKEFMAAVAQDKTYDLRFPAIDEYTEVEMADYDQHWAEIGDVREWEATGRKVKVHQTIRARELWELITYCATYSAEPGIFFIDNANEMTNAAAYGQKVVATNPCGEQPLTPYAVCNLAAINLANMVDEHQEIDFQKVAEVVRTSVRFQDNVIDATPYFFDKNEQQAKGERRIGLGVMGLADLLIYCGKTYGSKEGNALVDQLFETIAVTAYQTSIELAKEKGSFPYLVGKNEEETRQLRERFIHSGYMKKMPEHIRQGVLTYGIRNSHLLTVAPTGSTGTMTGVSTGLEPYFSFSYFRSGRLGKFIEVHAEIVDEYLAKHPEADASELPEYFVSAMELSPEAHVDVQCTIQRWVDSSISKTVNAPKGYRVKEVADIYERLYQGGAKGGTVYVDGSRDSQVLTLSAEENSFTDELVTSEVHPDVLLTEASNDSATSEERCPICHEGTIEEIGGCSTCTHCKVQLKCGL